MDLPDRDHTLGVGIDFGTTYTGAALYRFAGGMAVLRDIQIENVAQTSKFPTRVYQSNTQGHPPLIGTAALNAARLDDDDTAGRLYSLFKLQLGKNWSESRGGRQITAGSLTRDVLEKVRLAIEAEVGDELRANPGLTLRYAFSYPGTWHEEQIAALGKAIRAAGFPTTFSSLDESVATALGAARHLPGAGLLARGNHILICDLGGGTLDLAVVVLQENGAIRVKGGAGGNDHLGMSNLDKVLALLWLKKADIPLPELAERVLRHHLVNGLELDSAWDSIVEVYPSHRWRSDLLRRAEIRKIEVCRYWDSLPPMLAETLPSNHQILFSRADLQPFVDRMNQEVQASIDTYIRGLETHGITYNSITCVVFSGGGSGLPQIASHVEELFARHRTAARPVTTRTITSDGPLMVQHGTAIFAFDPSIVKERRFNASYGVRTSDPEKPAGYTDGWPTRTAPRGSQKIRCYDKYQRLFHRHDPIPSVAKTFEFPPVGDGPGVMVLEVRRGDDENPDKNEHITEVSVTLGPDSTPKKTVQLIFKMQPTGLMQVKAYNPHTGEWSGSQEFRPFDDPQV